MFLYILFAIRPRFKMKRIFLNLFLLKQLLTFQQVNVVLEDSYWPVLSKCKIVVNFNNIFFLIFKQKFAFNNKLRCVSVWNTCNSTDNNINRYDICKISYVFMFFYYFHNNISISFRPILTCSCVKAFRIILDFLINFLVLFLITMLDLLLN